MRTTFQHTELHRIHRTTPLFSENVDWKLVTWEPFRSKCHFWMIWVTYIVGIRRARSIFMQNCGALLPFCEELLTCLFCSISKTTNVIRTRVFYVHFSQWELLMSRTNNHVTHTLPLFTGLGNFRNWFLDENASNGKYIHVLNLVY